MILLAICSKKQTKFVAISRILSISLVFVKNRQNYIYWFHYTLSICRNYFWDTFLNISIRFNKFLHGIILVNNNTLHRYTPIAILCIIKHRKVCLRCNKNTEMYYSLEKVIEIPDSPLQSRVKIYRKASLLRKVYI